MRLFRIAQGANVTIKNVILQGGDLTGLPESDSNGGTIYVKWGNLTLENVTIEQGKAANGGGIYNASNGTLTIKNSTISNNTATENGGGISNDGKLILENSTIAINSAKDGGGIYINSESAPVSMGNCTISRNIASNGARGITMSSGKLSIGNSIVANGGVSKDEMDFKLDGGTVIDCHDNIVQHSDGYSWDSNKNWIGSTGSGEFTKGIETGQLLIADDLNNYGSGDNRALKIESPDSIANTITEQTEIESRITGNDSAANDSFGKSVAISGDTAIIGASCAGTEGLSHSGAAYIFTYNGTSWVQTQKLIPDKPAAEDGFGTSVSISGYTAIIGSWSNNLEGFSGSGAIYIFKYNGRSWVQAQKLTPIDAFNNNRFGHSVSLSGDTAIVGCYMSNSPTVNSSGAAYIFKYDGTSWILVQKLNADIPIKTAYFGYSVAISGDTAIVGAIGEKRKKYSFVGAAYIFKYNGTTWIQEKRILPFNYAPRSTQFGYSAAISGNTAVIGGVERQLYFLTNDN